MLQKAGLLAPQQTVQTVTLCPRCGKPVAEKDMSLCPSCGSVLSLKAAAELEKQRDQLQQDVEELKKVVGQLVSSGMKPETSRGEIEAQVTSRKRIVDALKKDGLVEE
jgi:uncharacterized Zn finger protein (UPF0148 family)